MHASCALSAETHGCSEKESRLSDTHSLHTLWIAYLSLHQTKEIVDKVLEKAARVNSVRREGLGVEGLVVELVVDGVRGVGGVEVAKDGLARLLVSHAST